ncbi:putative autotransporter adhesin-like protein [Aquimarina sp. MAR_2010_214]|uniref:head GIN domain-containing protein n=1 Tax=Aquimarina sp. MAR_2010_214 TaxID=1250026 RepID=UPI000C714C79|nr:head GIN domain-containing protein [Aquimarina sp. MAR_2010_214]PKV51778.1 putative autotransporter adhesin-like protein [Aquimarina sp. MAR_2010_214]
MKTQNNNFVALLYMVVSLFTINQMTAQNKLRGNGNVVTQERAISSFNEIIINGVYNVYLTQGAKESVKVETDENLQEVVVIKNKGNALVLNRKKGIKVKKKTKMNVYVTLKDIEKLEVRGVGNVKTSSKLSLNALDVEASGVGNTSLELDCKKLDGEISMVGNFTLKGKVAEVILNNNGTGALRAFDLVAQKLEINNSGIGKVEVNAQQEISITSSGIGSVYYKGDAKTTKLDHRGMGKIKKVD